MNVTVSDALWWFFYFLPFIILIFSKKLNRQFKLAKLTVRVVDVLIPYLILVNYISVQLLVGINSIPYIIIMLSVSGMLVATYQTIKMQSLTFYSFFRIWWRLVFLLFIAFHVLIGLWTLIVTFF